MPLSDRLNKPRERLNLDRIRNDWTRKETPGRSDTSLAVRPGYTVGRSSTAQQTDEIEEGAKACLVICLSSSRNAPSITQRRSMSVANTTKHVDTLIS